VLRRRGSGKCHGTRRSDGVPPASEYLGRRICTSWAPPRHEPSLGSGRWHMDMVKPDALALSGAIHQRPDCAEVVRAYLTGFEACAGANATVSPRPEDDLLPEVGRGRSCARSGALRRLAARHAAGPSPPAAACPRIADPPRDESGGGRLRRTKTRGWRDLRINTPGRPRLAAYNPVSGPAQNAANPSFGWPLELRRRGRTRAPDAHRRGIDHVDTLRSPAAWNNVFGLRSGVGRIVDRARRCWLSPARWPAPSPTAPRASPPKWARPDSQAWLPASP
jgi:hypothetical protein